MPSPAWPAVLAASTVTIAILFYYHWLWGSLDGFSAAIDHCPDLFCDFRLQFYPAGRSVLEHGPPVPGYFYGPAFASFLALFALAPLFVSLWLWGAFQIAALGALFLATLRADERPLSAGRAGLYVFIFLASVPILHNFKWGQVSVLLVACELLAFRLHDRSRPLCAAIALAAAIAIKSYPAMLLVYFVARGDYRFVLVCLFGVAVALIMPVGWLGWHRTLDLSGASSRALLAASQSWVQHDPNSQFLPHVVRRLASFGSGQGWLLGYSLAAAACTACLLAAWFGIRRCGAAGDRLARALVLLATPLWVPTSWPHYFAYLPFAQVTLLGDLAAHHGRSTRRTASAALLCVSIALSNVLALEAWPGWYPYSSAGVLLFADLALALACGLSLRPESPSHAEAQSVR